MVRQIALRFQIALTVNVDVEDLLLHDVAHPTPSGGVVAERRICPAGGKLPEKERTERCVKSHLQSYGLFRTRRRWSRLFPLGLQKSHHVDTILERESYCIGASGYIYCCWRGAWLESLDNSLVLENLSGSRSIDHAKER